MLFLNVRFRINLSLFFILFVLGCNTLAAKDLYYATPRAVQKLDAPIHIKLTDWSAEYFVIPVMINEKGPYHFMIDTGMSYSTLSKKLAQDLNLTFIKKGIDTGNYTRREAQFYKIASIGLGQAKLYDYEVKVFAEPSIISAMHHDKNLAIDGILGIGAFHHYLFTLDHLRNEIILESAQLDPKKPGVFPFADTQRVPGIMLTLKDETHTLTIPCLIDSGYNGYFTIPTSVSIPFKKLQEKMVKARSGINEYIVYKYQLDANATFADQHILNPEVLYGNGIFGVSGSFFGLIGLYVINEHKVTLDLQNRLLRIEE